MGKLITFTFVSLDGYSEGSGRDIGWHNHDAEESGYAAEMLASGNTLLFGRITYELMAGYWPTPEAIKSDPIVADGMNSADKIVFSRTLKTVQWKNTRLVNANMEEEIKRMKQVPGKNMTLLGSGSILTHLAQQGLIDEYQIMVNPVVLGDGTSIFKDIGRRLNLKLTTTRVSNNGNVVLRYQPGERHA